MSDDEDDERYYDAAQVKQSWKASAINNDITTTRPREYSSARTSIPEPVPPIPARFLENAVPARHSLRAQQNISTRSPSNVQRPATSGGEVSADARNAYSPEQKRSPSHRRNGVAHVREGAHESSELLSPASARRRSTSLARRRTLDKLEQKDRGSGHGMARQSSRRQEDLFMELAQDDGQDARPASRSGRAASRLSQAGKRRSLPADAILNSTSDRRPKTSGSILARPSSRLDTFSSGISQHMDRYRSTPSRGPTSQDDNVSLSGRSVSGRAQRFSALTERSQMSPSRLADRVRSPELPSYGRRRPSFGVTPPQPYKGRQNDMAAKAPESQDDSPADSSDPKRSQPDSASVDSQTDTVWDELDDLKSRIKKLELTGKLPPTSGAAVSGDSSDRPRTATTAPTTIESSPKHDRKAENEEKPLPSENTVGGPAVANIHPLLHSALAKAKPLLNATLYRTLEATAADALQLAAMTGSAGPQGTTFSAASIINGVTVADRHVRRKADTMCRNLTDLCLALCEGKHEAPSVTASPIAIEPAKSSPTIRYSRSSIGSGDNLGRGSSRPISRLDVRRSSILGVPPPASVRSVSHGPPGSVDEASTSEQESSAAQQQPLPELRRTSRASSRLLSARMPRYESASGDEDPTIRPPSRAMTDVGGPRNRTSGPREYSSPAQADSPGFRESLAARRANASSFEGNRDPSRMSSISLDVGRRRWVKESTPPVLEEEDNGSDYQTPPSQPRKRITSMGQLSARRAVADTPNRASSLSLRRHVVVE